MQCLQPNYSHLMRPAYFDPPVMYRVFQRRYPLLVLVVLIPQFSASIGSGLQLDDQGIARFRSQQNACAHFPSSSFGTLAKT